MNLQVTPPQEISVTLETGQGPRAVSTVEAQEAAIAAQVAQASAENALAQLSDELDQAIAAKLGSEQARDSSEQFSLDAAASALSAFEHESNAASSAASAFQSRGQAEGFADSAQTSNALSAGLLNTAISLNLAEVKTKVFANYADMVAATLANNEVVYVAQDETQGGIKTIYKFRSIGAIGGELTLNFATGVYELYYRYNLIAYQTPQLLPIPQNSNSFAFLGAYAVDTNFLYLGVGTNAWRRVPLSTF